MRSLFFAMLVVLGWAAGSPVAQASPSLAAGFASLATMQLVRGDAVSPDPVLVADDKDDPWAGRTPGAAGMGETPRLRSARSLHRAGNITWASGTAGLVGSILLLTSVDSWAGAGGLLLLAVTSGAAIMVGTALAVAGADSARRAAEDMLGRPLNNGGAIAGWAFWGSTWLVAPAIVGAPIAAFLQMNAVNTALQSAGVAVHNGHMGIGLSAGGVAVTARF